MKKDNLFITQQENSATKKLLTESITFIKNS